jgi:virB6 protein
MAGMWFNGVMASYSGYNAMQGWGSGQPATPPGMNSQQQTNHNVQNLSANSNNPQPNSSQQYLWTTGGSRTESTTTDAMKQPEQSGKGSKPS